MRQGQQNRRGRGRHNGGGSGGGGQSHTYNSNSGNNNNNNNNRKGQNPLTRSFESNGPDVKIRGNPAHIAEKYMTLARDAQSVGDSVLAESYLQHAEHYNRIIMAYREQQQGTEGQFRQRPQNEMQDGGGDQLGDDDMDGGGGEGQIRGQEPQPGIFDAQQSRFPERVDQPVRDDQRGNRDDRQARGYDDRQPRRNDGNRDGNSNRDGNRDGNRRDRYEGGNRGYNGNRDDRPERVDRPERIDRADRPERVDRPERRERFDRNQQPGQDRGQGERSYQERAPVDRSAGERTPDPRPAPEPREQRPLVEPPAFVAIEAEAAPLPREAAPPPARRRSAPVASPPADRFADVAQEQPEFLRRPVRRPRREAAAPVDASETGAPPADDPPLK
jgi:Domain of unknown function (DUF4167)